ncbi:Down syndrome cell adhesion molecule-like protein Dscam2 [Eumeta japonica]|uniref:Down syndrome cell adhesion molecule-like protein Dscam2 n=1 Tax=Eumeta variegata TaxID=151549 RepID=A0A4C1W7T8_EUMVA|nr:Down syndrome cell adhesion molecule-like protein Dscam2 [Eumeta japonica]
MPYSPDLAPYNFYLYPKIIENFKENDLQTPRKQYEKAVETTPKCEMDKVSLSVITSHPTCAYSAHNNEQVSDGIFNTANELETSNKMRRKRSINLVMSQHFTETTVTPGVDVSLKCSADGRQPSRFAWERDGVAVSTSTDPRYALGQAMLPGGGVVTELNISNVRVDDGGLYVCIAHQGDNKIAHEDRLNVYGPPFIRMLPPIKIQSGQSVDLRCPYYGYPIKEISWEYKGRVINSEVSKGSNRYKRALNYTIANVEGFGRKPKLRRKRELASLVDNYLNVLKVTKNDNGATYSCTVKSPSGEMAKRSFELHVVEGPELEEILLAPDLREGQIVQINCNLKSGDSPVYFSWLKEGKKIPSHLKIVERSIEFFSVLVIKNVSLEHCGTYTCVAANHVAKVNRTVNLYIKVAPKWSEEPKNTSLLLGKSGHVACNAMGYPQPQTHWLKRDAVSDTWRPVLEVAGGGVLSLSNGSLIFDRVSLSDAGLYTCHVENGVGEPLSRTIGISVNTPVNFDAAARNVTAKVGQHVAIDCQAKGDEPIRIMWTRNGQPINPLTQRVKISEAKTDEGLSSLLELPQTEPSDGALYQCKAGNPYGADIFTATLTIIEPPAPPTDVSVDSVKSRSAILSWRDSGNSLAQYYSVQYTPSLRMAWSAARTLNVTKSEGIRHSVELEALQPAAAYSARVAAGNEADLSPYSAPVRFSTNEEVVRMIVDVWSIRPSIAAPSSAPVGVQVEQTDAPGELRVKWFPPPSESHNGVILGYKVRCVAQVSNIKGQIPSEPIRQPSKVALQNDSTTCMCDTIIQTILHHMNAN